MEVYPDYLERFSCTASDCRHSCCIGWEIDIDEASLSRFRSEKGELGEKLKNNIYEDENGAGFILDENERCPFLLKNGFCELICEKGSGYLCNICADHPRFRSFFTGVTEIGIGLCCEEAARVIITNQNRVRFVNTSLYEALPDDEKTLVQLRSLMIETAQNSSLSISQSEKEILGIVNAGLNEKSPFEWAEIIEKTEKLSDERDWFLSLLKKADEFTCIDSHSLYAEQLLVYFLFRHIPDSMFDGLILQRTAFCILAERLIMTAFSQSDGSEQTLCSLARIFSSEVEYSDENLHNLILLAV